MVLSRSEQSILRTLSYADVFKFPLTKEEIWKYIISDKSFSRASFEQALKNLSSLITFRLGYYSLVGHERYSIRRSEAVKAKYLEKKIAIAKKAAFFLSYIPTVLFIGISGSVAVGNVQKHDDIDLFIITKKNTVFTTRLLILVLLECLGLRRGKNDKKPENKICVNLLVDEQRMHWPRAMHDLYLAHEIAQVKPLFNRNKTYEAFIEANSWVSNFLPHVLEKLERVGNPFGNREYIWLKMLCFFINLFFVSYSIEMMQRFFIQRTHTIEIVSSRMLAFHPVDYRLNTLRELGIKEKKLRSLTKI